MRRAGSRRAYRVEREALVAVDRDEPALLRERRAQRYRPIDPPALARRDDVRDAALAQEPREARLVVGGGEPCAQLRGLEERVGEEGAPAEEAAVRVEHEDERVGRERLVHEAAVRRDRGGGTGSSASAC